MLIKIVLSLFPVLLFLAFLFLLDSFKLVIKKYLAMAIGWGMVSALCAYFINTFLLQQLHFNFTTLSHYISPGIEELLKILLVIFIIKQKRVGFMIDAAIYGFAIGAGFSLVENVFYLRLVNDPNLLIWILRGFGTSLMHGGCTALFAVIIIGAKNQNASSIINFTLGLVVAYVIHSVFNHFYIAPIFQTIGIIILLPILFILIFTYNEKQLQNWLEIEFTSEIELLKMIKKGQFLNTRSGEYMATLKSKFSGETLVDMYCFISINLELSIKAKRNLMLKESGFPIIIEEDIRNKLDELSQLRKQIGKIGELTLSPLISMNYRDLWKLNSLK